MEVFGDVVLLSPEAVESGAGLWGHTPLPGGTGIHSCSSQASAPAAVAVSVGGWQKFPFFIR